MKQIYITLNDQCFLCNIIDDSIQQLPDWVHNQEAGVIYKKFEPCEFNIKVYKQEPFAAIYIKLHKKEKWNCYVFMYIRSYIIDQNTNLNSEQIIKYTLLSRESVLQAILRIICKSQDEADLLARLVGAINDSDVYWCIKHWQRITNFLEGNKLYEYDTYPLKIGDRLFKCWINFLDNNRRGLYLNDLNNMIGVDKLSVEDKIYLLTDAVYHDNQATAPAIILKNMRRKDRILIIDDDLTVILDDYHVLKFFVRIRDMLCDIRSYHGELYINAFDKAKPYIKQKIAELILVHDTIELNIWEKALKCADLDNIKNA